MYALAVGVSIAEDKFEQAQQMLESEIVPMVKSQPGFVAGYWMSPGPGKGYSIVIFETKEQAEAGAQMARGGPPNGGDSPVTMDVVAVYEVVAHA